MDHSEKRRASDEFLQHVYEALLKIEGYDPAESAMAVTVQSDLIERRRLQGMSASDVADYLAAIAADTQAMSAGNGESEQLRALRDEEITAYEQEEKARIAAILGLEVNELTSDALRHMWEEIPTVIRSLWNEKPWLAKRSVVLDRASA